MEFIEFLVLVSMLIWAIRDFFRSLKLRSQQLAQQRHEQNLADIAFILKAYGLPNSDECKADV